MIIQDPDPILRNKNSKIDAVFAKSKEFKDLLSELNKEMLKAGGIGIAAPQIGVNKQVAIIKKMFIYPYCGHLHILINPTYEPAGATLKSMDEGCLSVKHGKSPEYVQRYSFIDITYDILEKDGRLTTTTERVGGFLSRIIQHEIQHLHGTLFTDKELLCRKKINKCIKG